MSNQKPRRARSALVVCLVSLGWFVGLGLAIYACALIGSQLVYWLKTGEWLQIAVGSVFMEHFDDQPWPLALVPDLANEKIVGYIIQASPARWVGMQKIVSWLAANVPLSLAAYALSFVAFASSVALSEAAEREARARE